MAGKYLVWWLACVQAMTLSNGFDGVGSLNVNCFFSDEEERFILARPKFEFVSEGNGDENKGYREMKLKYKSPVALKQPVREPDDESSVDFLEEISSYMRLNKNYMLKLSCWVSKKGDSRFERIQTQGQKTIYWYEYHGNKPFATFKEYYWDNNICVIVDENREMWLKFSTNGKRSISRMYWARAVNFEDIKKWSHLHDGIWHFSLPVPDQD